MALSARGGAGLQVGGDGREVRGACDAIDEADAVEQQGRCEGTQQEVLDRRLIRDGLVARDPDQHVGAQRHELQPQVEDQEIDGRCGQHHSGRGQQEQRMVLGGPNALRIEVPHREERRQRQVRREEHLEERGVAVGRRRASEPSVRDVHEQGQPNSGDSRRHDRAGLRQHLRVRSDVRRR